VIVVPSLRASSGLQVSLSGLAQRVTSWSQGAERFASGCCAGHGIQSLVRRMGGRRFEDFQGQTARSSWNALEHVRQAVMLGYRSVGDRATR